MSPFHLQCFPIIDTATTKMQLLDLPDELLEICCSRIDELTEPIDEDAYPTAEQINLEALRNLRLTCKRISPLVSKHLFS